MTSNEETINLVEDETPRSESLTSEQELLLKEMMNAGVFYGYSKSRTHPKMKAYILSTRAGVEVIDLVKTIESLNKAAEVIKQILKNGGTILMVGTTPAAKVMVKEMATRLGWFYVMERWMGGMLTNFKTIADRIKYFQKLKEDKAAGNLEKYTKKERILIDEELAKLEKLFSGIETMDKLPSLVFIVDLKANELAAKEAHRVNIPVVAFVNTDADPDLAAYPVPANTRNSKSLEFVLAYLEKEVGKETNG